MLEQILGVILAFFGGLITFAFIKLVVIMWKDDEKISALLFSWFIIMGVIIFFAGVGVAIEGIPN